MKALDRKQKVVIGSILTSISVALCTLSAYIIMNPIMPANVEMAKAKLINECRQHITSNNYETINKNGLMEITSYGLSNWESDIAKLSVVATSCNGFDIEKFCIGNECKTMDGKSINGATMTLRYNGKLKQIIN